MNQPTTQLIDNMNTAFFISDHIGNNLKKDGLKFDFLKKTPQSQHDPNNISSQLLKDNKHKMQRADAQHHSQINQENMMMYKQLLLSLQEANNFATLLNKEYFFQILTAPSQEQLPGNAAVKYDRNTLIQKTYTAASNGSQKKSNNTIMDISSFYKLHATLQRRYFESTDREKQLQEIAHKHAINNKSQVTLPTIKHDSHTNHHNHHEHAPLIGLINQKLALHNKHYIDGTIITHGAAPSQSVTAVSCSEQNNNLLNKSSNRRVSVLNVHTQMQHQLTAPSSKEPPPEMGVNSTRFVNFILMFTRHFIYFAFSQQRIICSSQLLDFIERQNEVIL
jgi:hypothetical protein